MNIGNETKLEVVPNFIKASSPDLLREAMFLNNLRLKSEIKYQDIQQSKDGTWYAWFYDEVDYYSKIKPKKVK